MYEWFGNAQLVDTIAQGCHVLLDREVLPFFDLQFGHAHQERRTIRSVGDRKICVSASDDPPGNFQIFGIAKPNRDNSVIQIDAAADAFLNQSIKDRLLVTLHAIFDRRVHINFEQDINTTAKIETQTHGSQPHIAHPVRDSRRECQCNIRILAVARPEAIGSALLVLLVVESNDSAFFLEKELLGNDAITFERAHEAVELSLSNSDVRRVGELHGRRAAVNVRQREQNAHQKDEDNKRV